MRFLPQIPGLVPVLFLLIVAGIYGIFAILDRIFDDPIMRKQVNASSSRWKMAPRYRGPPDPRKFRDVGKFDDDEEEESRDSW